MGERVNKNTKIVFVKVLRCTSAGTFTQLTLSYFVRSTHTHHTIVSFSTNYLLTRNQLIHAVNHVTLCSGIVCPQKTTTGAIYKRILPNSINKMAVDGFFLSSVVGIHSDTVTHLLNQLFNVL